MSFQRRAKGQKINIWRAKTAKNNQTTKNDKTTKNKKKTKNKKSGDVSRNYFVLLSNLIPCVSLNDINIIFEGLFGVKLKYDNETLLSLVNTYTDLFVITQDGNKTVVFSKYFSSIKHDIKGIPYVNQKYIDMIKFARKDRYKWYSLNNSIPYSLDEFRFYSDLFIVHDIHNDTSVHALIISRIHGTYFLHSNDEINEIIHLAKFSMPVSPNISQIKSDNDNIVNEYETSDVEMKLKMDIRPYCLMIAKLFPSIQFDNDNSFSQFCLVLFNTDLIALANENINKKYTLETLLSLFPDIFIWEVIYNCIQITSKYLVYSHPKNYSSNESRIMIQLARTHTYFWHNNMIHGNINSFVHYSDLFFVIFVHNNYLIISRIIGSDLLPNPHNVVQMATGQYNIINSVGSTYYGYQNKYEIITIGYEKRIKSNRLNDLNKQCSQLNDIIKQQNNIINGLNQLNDEIISKNKSMQDKYHERLRDDLELKCDDKALNESNMDELCNLHNKCVDNAGIIKKEIQERRENELLCIICCDNENNAVFDPCGHKGCYNCLTQLNICHICRSQITRVIQFKL